MFVNNVDLTPPKELLEKCFQVKVRHGDQPEPSWKMKKWAKAQCKSFVWMDVEFGLDDATYIFYFAKEEDKIMFALKCI